jgi:glycosyltransferase involved in cell wall biosynthesis
MRVIVSTSGLSVPQSGKTAVDSRDASSKAVEAARDAAWTDIPPAGSTISLVIPLMNEEGNLAELHRRLTDSLVSLGMPYEIVFIDDGSTDGTWNLIRETQNSDPHVVALRHRRNFGKAQALANGFAVARGEVVITMDGDLQDDPDELPRMVAELNEGYDLVSGWKRDRQDPVGKTLPSKLFNWTVRKVTGVPLHDFNCGFKAYRHEVTNTIRLYGELHRFTPVLAAAEGFRVTELPVRHHARRWGSSKYGLKRLIKGFLDLITVFFLTNYRQRPMHLFGLPGMLALGLGVLIGLKLTYDRLVLDLQIGTRPLLLLAVLLVVVGTQFFALGLLGEFLAHGSNRQQPDLDRYLRTSLGVDEERSPLRPAGASDGPPHHRPAS